MTWVKINDLGWQKLENLGRIRPIFNLKIGEKMYFSKPIFSLFLDRK